MRWLLVLSLVGCGSTAPTDPPTPPPDPPAACTPAADLVFTPGTRFEIVSETGTTTWPVAGVTWTAGATAAGGGVHLEGVLTNTTDAEVFVDVLSGGVMGISTNPFQIDVDGETLSATGPEIYPAPQRITLPPHGVVTYTRTRCPPMPAHVRWTFSPWGGHAITGEATLP